MDKLVFLDIDDVLNGDWNDYSRGPDVIDSRLLNMLADAIGDIPVVVNSSWRLHFNLDQLKDRLKPLNVIDVTQVRFGYYKTGISDWSRSCDVKDWLDDHNFSGKYLVIDDANVALHPQVRPVNGLDYSDIDSIKIFFRDDYFWNIRSVCD